jgi:DHA1 family tetracycline resistance protein-like MFS transporter
MSLLYNPNKIINESSFRNFAAEMPPLYLEPRNDEHQENKKRWQHLYVLPVLLMEFLALALTRAVIPALLLDKYGSNTYLIMGLADFFRGLLAFVSCPIFGRLSDLIGRRACLLATVFGTCAPVCSLAFFSWEPTSYSYKDDPYNNVTAETEGSSGIFSMMGTNVHSDQQPTVSQGAVQPLAITVFVVLLSISGIFSSTFTLVFAYISDSVRQQDERVAAYGLALATFGLSFTIGPMAGGYLAQTNKQYVFLSSLILTVMDLLYIYFVLPESRELNHQPTVKSTISLVTLDHTFSWNPVKTIRLILVDSFLRKVGEVAFLYYTGLWALISTLSVYAVKRFHLTPERLGELMSAFGLCTMVAEAILVRIVVSSIGEKRAVKVGLLSFGLQCIILGFAYESWHLFVLVFFSLAGNLVYPSLSSLVSGSVEPDAVGEALGAINGIKALTEGIGPLVFGSLMTLSETSPLPGWPYLIAAVLVAAAYKATDELPDPEEDDYVHELECKSRRTTGLSPNGLGDLMMTALSIREEADDKDDEREGLLWSLSEVEEDEAVEERDVSKLPITFASLMVQKRSDNNRGSIESSSIGI